MQPRQGIVEIFSTFVRFDSDRFTGWITDANLHRHIQNCLQSAPETSELFWVLYWHRQWQGKPGTGSGEREEVPSVIGHWSGTKDTEQRTEDQEQEIIQHPTSNIQNSADLALGHLTAYLQEPCYWVSRKMAVSTNGQSVADLFQTAIARIHSILKGFNPQLSMNFKGYAEFVFSNVIKDTLRQRREADICTDWALLHKTSQRRLVQALERAGLDSQTIASYRLAWNCFKELDTASDIQETRKLTRPEAAIWQAIAQLYNSQRLSQPGGLKVDGTPERLEQWLLACARAVRLFLYPKPLSIDIPTVSEDSPSLLETLADREQNSLLTQLIWQEERHDREQQQQQLIAVLTTAIAHLDSQSRQLLQDYYGEDLTQQQIAQHLGIKQYTVSRRLTSMRQTLLKQIGQWGQETLHISLTSDVLSSMSTLLDEWLRAYYHPSDTYS